MNAQPSRLTAGRRRTSLGNCKMKTLLSTNGSAFRRRITRPSNVNGSVRLNIKKIRTRPCSTVLV